MFKQKGGKLIFSIREQHFELVFRAKGQELELRMNPWENVSGRMDSRIMAIGHYCNRALAGTDV